MRVPRCGGLSTSRRPLRASTRAARPRRPEPAAGVGAPDAVVGHRHRRAAVRPGDAHRRVRRLRVLGHVRDRLRDHVVGRRLDRRLEPSFGQLGDLDRHGRPRQQRVERCSETALGEQDGVKPARQLSQLLEPLREIVLGRRQKLAGGLRVVVELRPGHAQLQCDGDEALLSAVVEVALESPPLGVADRHELGTRCGQPLPGVGVGKRLPDEVREVAESMLEPVRQRLVRRGGRHQRAPQPARHGDRRRHRGAVPGAPQGLGQAPARFVVALHALGGARAHHLREDGVAVEVERRPHRQQQPAVLAPTPDDRRPARTVVLDHGRAGQPQQAPDLFGHLLEHAARRRLRGHERCDPAQRRLLVGQLALGRLADPQRPGRPGALGGDRREQERSDSRGRDEELRCEQAVGDRVTHERPLLLGRVPHRDRAHHDDRRGGASRP